MTSPILIPALRSSSTSQGKTELGFISVFVNWHVTRKGHHLIKNTSPPLFACKSPTGSMAETGHGDELRKGGSLDDDNVEQVDVF